MFSVSEQKEVAILHSETCLNTMPCSDCPAALKNKIRLDDQNGLMHFQAICYMKSGVIKWKMLEQHIEGSVLHEFMWDKMDNKSNV